MGVYKECSKDMAVGLLQNKLRHTANAETEAKGVARNVNTIWAFRSPRRHLNNGQTRRNLLLG